MEFTPANAALFLCGSRLHKWTSEYTPRQSWSKRCKEYKSGIKTRQHRFQLCLDDTMLSDVEVSWFAGEALFDVYKDAHAPQPRRGSLFRGVFARMIIYTSTLDAAWDITVHRKPVAYQIRTDLHFLHDLIVSTCRRWISCYRISFAYLSSPRVTYTPNATDELLLIERTGGEVHFRFPARGHVPTPSTSSYIHKAAIEKQGM